MFNWKLAYAPNYECKDLKLQTINDVEKSGYTTVPAEVPGNFELDLMREELLPPLYYSTNTLKAQELENLHLWYYTDFEITDKNSYIHFEGIDTFADIYINGKLVKSTNNMFIAYDVYADFNIGKNEMVVHIKPTSLEVRNCEMPAMCDSWIYGWQFLGARKAAHMFGWDIHARIVSAGIWKNVEIRPIKKDEIKDVLFITNNLEVRPKTAKMYFYINTKLSGDFARDYSVRIKGVCGDSSFDVEKTLWHSSYGFYFEVENRKLWWPRYSGEQNLYDTTIELLYKGEVCDTYRLNVGIRTVALDMTESTNEAGDGEFCFIVNNKKIFAYGTNWVGLDAFHSQDYKRLDKSLELLYDNGCNIVRCWGGSVYESDEFYDFCDKNGIMVWQDFALACGIYPLHNEMRNLIYDEAVFQIKRLRNHSSLILWAGDNECDLSYGVWATVLRDPNENLITRKTLKHAVMVHDGTRPYLPSSPYISKKVYEEKLASSEDHLWGPRDYFKGSYYKNTVCHFASETGYHGFPSPKSLSEFLENPEKIFNDNFVPTDEYLVHAASPEADLKSPSAMRIKLAYDQVVTLFGSAEENLDDFIKQSQISQAEAKKYFIERFRLSKWRRTGIIWWNLLDGWPQVSDAIVDYYFTKKLAYHYIKRSQQPVCLMFDEPNNNIYDLYAVNEFPYSVTAEYTVTDVLSDKILLSGKVSIPEASSVKAGSVGIEGQHFLLIKWTIDGKEYTNHHFTNILDIDYKEYMTAIEKCGYDQFEGF